MKTGIFVRAAAVLLTWTGISAAAGAQAYGSTSADEGMMTLERVEEPINEADLEALEAGAGEAIERMSQWLGTFDRVRSGLEKNDGFIRSDDELVLAFLFSPMEGESKLLRQYVKSLDVAMGTVPDSFYTRLDSKVEALWAEIHRIAPRVVPVQGEEADPTMRAAITQRVIQGAPEATIVRTALAGDDWRVRVSDAGLPRSKYRRGWVMYRLPEQELVVCQQLVVERPYFGGAERPGDYTVRLGYLRLQQTP